MDIKIPDVYPVGWIGRIGRHTYKIIEKRLSIGISGLTLKKAVLIPEL